MHPLGPPCMAGPRSRTDPPLQTFVMVLQDKPVLRRGCLQLCHKQELHICQASLLSAQVRHIKLLSSKETDVERC